MYIFLIFFSYNLCFAKKKHFVIVFIKKKMFGQQRPIKMDFIKKNYNNQSVSGVLELNTHTHTK